MGSEMCIRDRSQAGAVRSAIEDITGEQDTTTDLLGGAQDFDTWNGDIPPGQQIQAEIHSEKEDGVSANVTVRRNKEPDLTKNEEDKISVVSNVTPPPAPGAVPPGLNPFTPEWFAQVIGAAATAAATAVANSARPPTPAPSPNPAAPRRLNDRKVPDF